MISRFRPARTQVDNAEIITDLDALISKPIAFLYQGKKHLIKPITTEVFFKITNALARMSSMKDKKDLTEKELVQMYVDCFSSVCETIGAKEVEGMTNAQCGALLQAILDCVNGRAHIEDEKKKTIDHPPISA